MKAFQAIRAAAARIRGGLRWRARAVVHRARLTRRAMFRTRKAMSRAWRACNPSDPAAFLRRLRWEVEWRLLRSIGASAGEPGSRRTGFRGRPIAAMRVGLVNRAPKLLAATSPGGNRDAEAALTACVQAEDHRTARVIARLATSAVAEHREVARALTSAVARGDGATVRAITHTAQLEPDLRTEKVVSRRHRFLWICNPKVASRSIIDALLSADPDAEVFGTWTLDEILAVRPEVRGYFSFAFIRHPCHRALSFYAEKYAGRIRSGCPEAIRALVEPYWGVRPDMTFAEWCRWLDTPYGSDRFANRHWLSQHRQIRLPDGRLPDFVGRYERLEADWKAVTARLGLPRRPLPWLNRRPVAMAAEAHPDDGTAALLKRRYAEDFRLGGYDA